MHPNIERSIEEHDVPTRVKLTHFENYENISSILEQILSTRYVLLITTPTFTSHTFL